MKLIIMFILFLVIGFLGYCTYTCDKQLLKEQTLEQNIKKENEQKQQYLISNLLERVQILEKRIEKL